MRGPRRRSAAGLGTELDGLMEAVSIGGFAVGVDGDGLIVRWSEGARRIFGFSSDEVLGRRLAAFWPEWPGLGHRERAPRLVSLEQRSGSRLAAEVAVSPVRRSGRPAGAWIVGRPVGNDWPAPARDHVTGLASRSLLLAALVDRLDRGRSAAALIVEIVGVDAVDETFGYQAGDEALRVLAARLTAVLTPGDIAARFFRRFVVLVDDGAGRDLEALGRAVIAGLGSSVDVIETTVPITVRVGASRVAGGDDPAMALRHADLALFAADAVGSGCEVYDPGAHRLVESRREREIDLRSAVSRRELLVHYQPVVDLHDNSLVGAEALIRWQRASGELVMPGDFIDLAEASGEILGIGLWILEEACRQVRDWNERYRPADPLEIAVNLSVRQLSSRGLTGDVAGVLGGVGIDPGCVTLEVTESSVMDDPDGMIRRLGELREMGLTLSMDDFGTGYSSLSYLRQLPVDVVKIDRSFVGGVARTDEEWALAGAIVRLARSLGKRTLAEGVETPAQLAHLRALHCDLAQGFLFSRPLPADEFEALLRSPGAKLPGS